MKLRVEMEVTLRRQNIVGLLCCGCIPEKGDELAVLAQNRFGGQMLGAAAAAASGLIQQVVGLAAAGTARIRSSSAADHDDGRRVG